MINSSAAQYNIAVSEEGRDEDRNAILYPLIAYNRASGPPTEYRMLALLLKDVAGSVIGGLWGRTSYDWLFVELLFIPESLRRAGLGRALMLQAEQLARERHCTGIWLDTFDFQAKPFYEKLGYSVFGELRDHPRGISQYWLQKRLDGC
jgi:GNAT superfamily N-acetyltransferase